MDGKVCSTFRLGGTVTANIDGLRAVLPGETRSNYASCEQRTRLPSIYFPPNSSFLYGQLFHTPFYEPFSPHLYQFLSSLIG
jgi:hypothetical protein